MPYPGIGRDDRVLCIGINDLGAIAELVSIAAEGLVVIASDSEAFIDSGRQAFAARDNVMFIPMDVAGLIPWRDAIFTAIIASKQVASTNEMRRVLMPGGRIFLKGSD